MNEFLANGGNGFTVFGDITTCEGGEVTDPEALVDHLEATTSTSALAAPRRWVASLSSPPPDRARAGSPKIGGPVRVPPPRWRPTRAALCPLCRPSPGGFLHLGMLDSGRRPADQDPGVADQPPAAWSNRGRFRRPAVTRRVYPQQTKNPLVSYSPKKLGFF
ncbi:hypothetical protein [Streptomyces sp. R44]|uniref:Uncharacterized protein n=1 Tax=Streptomyces sp. R44 TaxID=3238633 RepID=A0AB39TD34_9ACTN